MSRYLITGGAGFIGSHLGERLRAAGAAVVVIDDLSTGSRGNLSPGTAFIEGDINDASALAAAFEGVTGCYHLAAIASVQQYRDGWDAAAMVNLIGSLRVMQACARRGIPLVYASSAAVYGDKGRIPLDEAAPTGAISGYGADKLGCELHAAAMAGALGLRATGLRFFNVFGPRQAPGSAYSGVISIFLDRLMRGEALTVFGDGGQSRDFVHAGDVARALTLAMAATEAGGAGRVFNICRGEAVTIVDLARRLARIIGGDCVIDHAPERAGDIRLSLGDPRRAAEALGFVAEIGLDDGLRDTARWFGADI